jgi:DNA polymerase III sliding clamp (beta) subunit (PCNA family)
MIAAVRRAALVAERAGPVRLSFRPDVVTIEAHAEGRARAAETVGADFVGEHSVMTFNPHHLLDGLTAAVAAAATTTGKAGATAKAGAAEKAGAVEKAGAAEKGEPAAPIGGPPEEGRIRLEFTSAAKPALITWAGYNEQDAGSESEGSGAPKFRYLVVPLRVPARG